MSWFFEWEACDKKILWKRLVMVCKWGLLDSQVYSDEEGNWFRKVAGGSMAIVIGFEEM